MVLYLLFHNKLFFILRADFSFWVNVINILVDGKWLEWSNWDSCSQTCDKGKQKRTRDCTPFSEGGYNCSGDTIEFKSCQLAKCSG